MNHINKQAKCLIIGGHGFIGSNLLSKLVKSNRTMSVLDHNPARLTECQQIRFIRGDFGDKTLINSLLDEHDEVIHLAYASVPNTSFDNPLQDLNDNLAPAVQLFELAAKHGCRLLLASSGGTVYGEAQSTPIRESHPTWPISPYGVTKLTIEKYAHLYAQTHGLKVICARPANPFGEGQLPNKGQGFIPTAIALVLQGKPVTVFGERGTIRDYIHIDDLTDGLVTLLDKGTPGETYNIGSSVGRSNLDILNAIRPHMEQYGAKMDVIHAPARPFDVQTNILDSSKLRTLGWEPKVDFESGIARTCSWLIDHHQNTRS